MKELLYLKDEQIKDLIEQLFYAYRETFADSKKILENHSFGIAHQKVIHLIERYEGITVSGLLRKLKITKQSLNRVLKDLNKNKKIIMKKLTSDGVLVSTPAGSTAYNLSVHGPILSLNSKKLAITPISPFRPRRWRGSIVSDRSVISINNLNINKRPVSVVADNIEFRNVKSVKIYINRKIKFHLLYDSRNSLNKKIKIEQVRKEIN